MNLLDNIYSLAALNIFWSTTHVKALSRLKTWLEFYRVLVYFFVKLKNNCASPPILFDVKGLGPQIVFHFSLPNTKEEAIVQASAWKTFQE